MLHGYRAASEVFFFKEWVWLKGRKPIIILLWLYGILYGLGQFIMICPLLVCCDSQQVLSCSKELHIGQEHRNHYMGWMMLNRSANKCQDTDWIQGWSPKDTDKQSLMQLYNCVKSVDDKEIFLCYVLGLQMCTNWENDKSGWFMATHESQTTHEPWFVGRFFLVHGSGRGTKFLHPLCHLLTPFSLTSSSPYLVLLPPSLRPPLLTSLAGLAVSACMHACQLIDMHLCRDSRPGFWKGS